MAIFSFGRKASSTINNSAELAAYLDVGYESSAGIAVTTTNAMKYSAVFACIKVLAEEVGQTSCHLYKRTGDDQNKAPQHRLYNLLRYSPNDYQTSQEWHEMMVMHLALNGNFYNYINRMSVTDEITEILPFANNAVTKKMTTQGKAVYEVVFPDGRKDILDDSQMLHISLMSNDGLTGMSIIEQARNAIGSAIAAETHAAKLWQNGATPGGVLTTDQILRDDVIAQTKKEWNESHGGADNAHKTAILGGGISWASCAMNSSDAQFLENRNFNRTEIAGMFRVPPHKIGILENSSYNNMEALDRAFYKQVIRPYYTRAEQRYHFQLLTKNEKSKYSFKYDMAEALRGDPETEAARHIQYFNVGVLNSNEIREELGMNKREGGDEYFVGLNMGSNKNTEESDNED